MNTLQKFVETVLFREFSLQLVAGKVQEKGYTLTKEDLAAIREALKNQSKKDRIELNLPSIVDDKLMQIKIDESDISRLLSDYEHFMTAELSSIVSDISKELLSNLKSTAHNMLKHQKNLRDPFEKKLYKIWREGLNLLEMLIVICTEAGEDINKEAREAEAPESKFEIEVMTRLHARSCQIANEVLTLVKAGYADGAHARWRTIHEISVVAHFIRQNGNDLAERYFLHNGIESYRAARLYQTHYVKLGLEPYPDDEMREIVDNYQHLISRFGSDYKSMYGWAAEALGKKEPKFDDIEQHVSLNHLRPYYKLASHNVHANPKGALFKLGLYNQNAVLLTGASHYGLAEPAQCVALSLTQVTIALLTIRPNIDRLAISSLLLDLFTEIAKSFVATQRSEGDSF